MALFINEDSKEITKDQVIVPDKLIDRLKLNKNLLGKYKDTDGYKRVSAIVDDDYNKRSDKKDRIHNDKHTISFSDLKRIDHDMRHMNHNHNNLEYVLQGGDMMNNWAHDKLNQMRSSVKKVKQVPEVPKLEQPKSNIEKPNKDIKIGNASVRITEDSTYNFDTGENATKSEYSNDEWHPYYDVMSEMTVDNILYEYYIANNDKLHWEQIQPESYKKALSEFVKYGRLIHFPSNIIYQWMGMMMRNTAKLRICTELAGHSNYFPSDEVYDFFQHNEEVIEKYQNVCQVNIEDIDGYDYEEWSDFFYETGFYDWCQLPDGSDALSDFGIEPLERIISTYHDNSSPEQTLVVINKMMDIMHCRGDLSSMFIVGGSKTLSQISENIKRKAKKIALTEAQLKILKEYRNQTVFNFDDEGNPYFAKDNWQHFIDFLEDIGDYGYLPNSGYKMEDIEKIVKDNYDEAYSYKTQFDYNEEDDEIAISNFIVEIQNSPNAEEYFNKGGEQFLKFYEWLEGVGGANVGNKEWYVPDFIESIIGTFDIDAFEDFLSSEGFYKLEDIKRDVFIGKLDDYGFPYNITLNDRGLIYIEREIIIPKYNSPVFKNGNDFYLYLKKTYGGIGEYWTWDEDSSESYNGSTYGGQTTTITLKGWVSPNDVNWEGTVYKNAYNLNCEKEIYIPSSDTRVELFAVEIQGNNVLDKPIIVPTTW